jgi:hypothetical protein
VLALESPYRCGRVQYPSTMELGREFRSNNL